MTAEGAYHRGLCVGGDPAGGSRRVRLRGPLEGTGRPWSLAVEGGWVVPGGAPRGRWRNREGVSRSRTGDVNLVGLLAGAHITIPEGRRPTSPLSRSGVGGREFWGAGRSAGIGGIELAPFANARGLWPGVEPFVEPPASGLPSLRTARTNFGRVYFKGRLGREQLEIVLEWWT